MMTARESVVRVTPERNAAEDTSAKSPGGVLGARRSAVRRPNRAPASRAGMITPEGTFRPKVRVVRRSFVRVPRVRVRR